MKQLIIFAFIIFTGVLYAQQLERHHKKIDELEKIKLLEALDLDEEAAIRFFTRRSEHKAKMRKLNIEAENLLAKLDDIIKAEADESEIKKISGEYIASEKNIMQERERFLTSLNDVLTAEQAAKFIIFERKFKEEIRNILMRERKKGRRNNF